jgi:hypothetical protein
MDFEEIARRLTGISLPIVGGGVSWEPSQSETTHARRLITFLEDRRVLYDPTEVEVPHHCISSILQIRAFLSDLRQKLNPDSPLGQTIRAMQAACRAFLGRNADVDKLDAFQAGGWNLDRWVFDQSLGELRATFGICIAELAVQHHLNVEEPLARILPADPDNV